MRDKESAPSASSNTTQAEIAAILGRVSYVAPSGIQLAAISLDDLERLRQLSVVR